jgi:GTPase SAR1 family protein
MVGVHHMETSAPLENLRDKIQKCLSDATPDQVGRFALQVERLEELQRFFQTYQEDSNGWKDKLGAPITELARAIKALNYKRPYRIAMIGLTGAGKSTLVNALLGRSLVLMKDISGPATGAALEIFLDVSESGTEKADVSYRDHSNIYALVQDFVEHYQLDASILTDKLDANFATSIRNLQPHNSLTEDGRTNFDKLRKALADIVIQYANNGNGNLRKNFTLADSREFQELLDLIDENSTINSENNPERRIGLVKAVTYHIKPGKNFNELPTLQLPGNVCLVDLPGLDGTPLHDIIISEGIKDADAIVFILRPPRILCRNSDADLLKRVREYISLEGSTQSGDRIFLVLNAKDNIMVDKLTLDSLPIDMCDLMDSLAPNYFKYFRDRGGEYPYFMTCAWAAYSAQKQLKGEQFEDFETYESVKIKLGVRDRGDHEVLEASQIPKLVEELTKFAREYRIEGQIRDGKFALDSIVETLLSNYESELDKLKQDQGELDVQSQEEQKLNEKQKEVEKLVIEFRSSLLDRFKDWRHELEQKSKEICNEIDDKLRQKMPYILENSFDDKWNLVKAKPIGQRN